MKTVSEIINANYVLVPLFKDTNMGYMITDRGDMDDYEWKVWRRATEIRAVKQLLSAISSKKTPAEIRRGLMKIVEFLNAEGVDAALVGTVAANDNRVKAYEAQSETTATFNDDELPCTYDVADASATDKDGLCTIGIKKA